jgi:hypothetical protein
MTDEEKIVAERRTRFFNLYGEVMWKLQLLEMSYWTLFSCTKMISYDDFEEAWTAAEKYMKNTLGGLILKVDLPNDLAVKSDRVRKMRNSLAHEFLRENVWGLDNEELYNAAMANLTTTSNLVAELDADIEQHLKDLGFDPDAYEVSDEDVTKIFSEEEAEEN